MSFHSGEVAKNVFFDLSAILTFDLRSLLVGHHLIQHAPGARIAPVCSSAARDLKGEFPSPSSEEARLQPLCLRCNMIIRQNQCAAPGDNTQL